MKTEKSAFLLFQGLTLWLALAAWLPTQVEAEPARLGAKGVRSSTEKSASAPKKKPGAGPADASDPRERAADAYDAGAEALARKDFREAARNFEQAHRVQPSEVAREQAIKSYTLANETARAASLALEAPHEHESLLRDALARHARVTVTCDGCTLELDGESQPAGSFFAAPGAHRVRAHFAQGSVLRRFNAAAGQRIALSLQSPAAGEPVAAKAEATAIAAPDARVEREASGLPKVFTYSLFGVTAVALGATTWSLFDMQSAGQRYEDALAQAERAPNAQNVARASDALEQARGKQQRSHWLIGTSAALLASSAVVGLLMTDWDGDSDGTLNEGPSLALAPGRAVASWRQSW